MAKKHLGPQFQQIEKETVPFDEEDASSDPELVRDFNKNVLNRSLGDPTHNTIHTYKTSEGPIATAITKHHPKGIVLDSVHVNHQHRGRGVGTNVLKHLTDTYGELHPSGHYVSQRALDWHHNNSQHFATDPEYKGDRIVEDEEGW